MKDPAKIFHVCQIIHGILKTPKEKKQAIGKLEEDEQSSTIL